MKRWLALACLATFILLGMAGFVRAPISECSQLHEQGAPLSLVAFLGVALLIWIVPIERDKDLKAIVMLLALSLAAAIYFRPMVLDQFRKDITGCLGPLSMPAGP